MASEVNQGTVVARLELRLQDQIDDRGCTAT
jgi:hypothetical protein